MENFFGIIFSGIFGAIFGSYATLFSYRLPLKESCFGRYFGPKSRCPNCGNVIKTKELIPVVNWFFTLGKCSKCKTKIPKSTSLALIVLQNFVRNLTHYCSIDKSSGIVKKARIVVSAQ